jgi:hypothetical protein
LSHDNSDKRSNVDDIRGTKYDANKMESEVLYKFMNNHGIEISAYLNVRRDTVVYWVSDGPHFENIKSDPIRKKYTTLEAFTDKLNQEGWTRSN